MQNSTPSPARGQWATSSYQVMYSRPGVGIHLKSVDPASRLRPEPEHLAATKRGKVVGFTPHSAQRLRELLFRLDYPPEVCLGVALTSAPWIKGRPSEAFAALTRDAVRCPGLKCAVWRKEVTRKGLEHYHLIVWAESPDALQAVRVWLVDRWCRHLVASGVCPGVAFLSGNRALAAALAASDPLGLRLVQAALDSLRWVNLSARNCTRVDQASALQYLCDHTSKHKSYQALTTGRAWGVWCRARLPVLSLPGVSLENCPRRLLADMHKALARMSRYWWPDDSAPFGYRWSRPRRFKTGSRVLFRPAAPAVLRRLVDAWNAREVSADGCGCVPVGHAASAPENRARDTRKQ